MAGRDYKIDLDMHVDGLREAINQLQKISESAKNETMMAVYAEANNLMTESQRIAPKDTGFLRGSNYVTKPTGAGAIDVTVGYAASYAAAVHEATNTSFKEPGTRAKFLEIPWLKKKKKIKANIAKRVWYALQKGSRIRATFRGDFPQEPKNRGDRPKDYGNDK